MLNYIIVSFVTVLIALSYITSIHMSFSRNVMVCATITACTSLVIYLFFTHALFIMYPAIAFNAVGFIARIIFKKPITPVFVLNKNLFLDSFRYGDYRQYVIKHTDGEYTPCKIVFPFPGFRLVEPVGKKSIKQERQDF